MKARCIKSRLSEIYKHELGFHSSVDPNYQITIGNIYPVISLTLTISQEKPISGFIDFFNDQEQLTSAPLCFFEFTDLEAPETWIVKNTNSQLALGPKKLLEINFFENFYNDDDDDETRAAYTALRQEYHCDLPRSS